LNTNTKINPKMMSNRRKIHFRRPVFFWYLQKQKAERHEAQHQFLLANFATQKGQGLKAYRVAT